MRSRPPPATITQAAAGATAHAGDECTELEKKKEKNPGRKPAAGDGLGAVGAGFIVAVQVHLWSGGPVATTGVWRHRRGGKTPQQPGQCVLMNRATINGEWITDRAVARTTPAATDPQPAPSPVAARERSTHARKGAAPAAFTSPLRRVTPSSRRHRGLAAA